MQRMKTAILSLSVVGVLAALPAVAAVAPSGTSMHRQAGAHNKAAPIQLAQMGVIDIYIDERGREVLVDARTGVVVGIRDPRVAPDFNRPDFGNYDRRDPYLDDRTLRALERREQRMRELGRSSRDLPDYRDRGFFDDPYYDDDPYFDGPDYTYGRQPRWDEPERPAWREPERARLPEPPIPQSRAALPDPVERRPLGETARLNERGEDSIETIIESDPDSRRLPDPSVEPDIGALDEQVAKVQVVLDRLGLSPGVIDGRMGDNVNKAISTYREMTGRGLRTYDRDSIEELLEQTGGPAFTTYEITAADAAGPFVASIPTDFGEKAQMQHLGYTSVSEKLAERFHMDERYLKRLNPGIDFSRPGSRIVVANVKRPERRPVARIIADKPGKQVRGYDANGRLVVAYPATIGSTTTPSPTGTHTVERIALDPEYTYNPRINFQQGNNDRILTIPPGPNGPVGSVWIGLSKPTFGIHGTPDPHLIGRTYSNGCVRLTNWDARELAGLVRQGVTVEFVN